MRSVGRGGFSAAIAVVGLIVGCGGSNVEQGLASGTQAPACVEPGQVIEFRTADGVQLTGALWGQGEVGVVLAHMYNGDLCQWRNFAPRLAARHLVLAFDFRGYSTRNPQPASPLENDVVAAAAELRKRGAKKVVFVGASMGGAVVLKAGVRARPRPAAVVALSAPVGASGVDASIAVKKLSMPLLFVAATTDRDFAAQARVLWRAATSRRKELAIYQGAHHGVDLLERTRVRGRVLAFLAAR